MVNADLLTRAMDTANLEGRVGRKAVEALFESLRAALQRGDRVVLQRFGVFHAAKSGFPLCGSLPSCGRSSSSGATTAYSPMWP